MAEKRFALIIATYQYDDTDLGQLVSPAHDAEALSQVLKDPVIGDFDVKVLLNKPSYDVKLEIETFFSDRKREELLLLYFTGHGIKDEDGKLYFATKDTKRKFIRATAVEANFVNDVMQRSRSRRQVLLLDCCYSGAFARGMVGKADRDIGTKERFSGSGRVVLTASDSMQYAFEGDQVKGKGVPSVFTNSLIHGLKYGEADRDGDGQISLDELYDYIRDRAIDKMPEQIPMKWNFGVQGHSIIIARNPNPVIKPAEPPKEIVDVEKYRTWLYQETESLDFRPYFLELSNGLVVRLTDLYFDMKFEKEGIEEIVKGNQRVLLEGKPGSGKSTILQFLAFILSRDKDILPLWFKASSLLSFVNQQMLKSRIQQLWKVLVQFWCEHHEVAKDVFNEDWFVKQLQQGKVLFIVDGMDELFDHSSQTIINIIDDVVTQYNASRWVITCLSSESNSPLRYLMPKHFRKFRIEPFSDEAIVSYVNLLTKVLINHKEKFRKVPPTEEAFKHDVVKMIFDRPDSIDFFRSPLALTTAICLYWNRKDESKLEMESYIYAHVIESLLGRRISETSQFPLKNDIDKIRKCLQLLALDVLLCHVDKTSAEKYFEDPKECVDKIAKNYFNGTQEKAWELIEWEESVIGLTVRDKIGDIRYHNKTVLLYLAACELAERFINNDPQSIEIMNNQFARKNENWQTIISFIPIIISQKRQGRSLIERFISSLLKSRVSDSLEECVRIIGGLKNILFYIHNLGINLDKITGFSEIKDKAMQLFDKQNNQILPKERYLATIAIGFAGDSRFKDSSVNWIFIPGGQIKMGTIRAEDEYCEPNEEPVHSVYTEAFEIGKYPVTVEEYLCFINDGGYTNKNFWNKDGLKWLETSRAEGPRYWQELQQFKPNCPVVYICYHEAKAYCKWLGSKNDKYHFQLPTEAQWEYVARRGENTYSAYVFSDIKPEKLGKEINWDNVENFHIRNICPVGMFPLDASKDNVRDMNGNVSEWTATSSTNYSEKALQADKQLPGNNNCRMVRGGSFRSYARDCRTARRTPQFKEADNYDLGFRVVRVPKPLVLKGSSPRSDYTVSLGNIFYKYFEQVTDSKEIPKTLKNILWFDYDNVLLYKKNLYPVYNKEERINFKRRPVVLGTYKGWGKKLAFNLRYQDSRIKLAVERKNCRNMSLPNRETDVEQISTIIAYIMNSKGIEYDQLWMDMTDGDLDGLVLQVLSAYDSEITDHLVKIGKETNKKAMAGLLSVRDWQRIPDLDFIRFQIFAGTMWWDKYNQSNAKPTSAYIEIEDIDSFKEVISKGEKNLVVIVDDNGELVWDMAFILRLLNKHPLLKITVVVNRNVIYNNACMDTINALVCDEQSPLHKLQTFLKQERLIFFKENCYRTSIDPKYCSKELLDLFSSSDLAFIKGSTGFETMQNLPVDTYYAFVSWGEDSYKYTNVKEGNGIFVRVPKGRSGYEYPEKTLKSLYGKGQLSA